MADSQPNLPSRVRDEVQRILDRAARRILNEQLEAGAADRQAGDGPSDVPRSGTPQSQP